MRSLLQGYYSDHRRISERVAYTLNKRHEYQMARVFEEGGDDNRLLDSRSVMPVYRW